MESGVLFIAYVPQCPKEKEYAIKAALKYFAMI